MTFITMFATRKHLELLRLSHYMTPCRQCFKLGFHSMHSRDKNNICAGIFVSKGGLLSGALSIWYLVWQSIAFLIIVFKLIEFVFVNESANVLLQCQISTCDNIQRDQFLMCFRAEHLQNSFLPLVFFSFFEGTVPAAIPLRTYLVVRIYAFCLHTCDIFISVAQLFQDARRSQVKKLSFFSLLLIDVFYVFDSSLNDSVSSHGSLYALYISHQDERYSELLAYRA